MIRLRLIVPLLLLSPAAFAEVIWCDPSANRCYRADSLETMLIPSNHCVVITEIDGEPVNAIACNRENRAAAIDLSSANSLAVPDPWRLFPQLEEEAQALARPVPEVKPRPAETVRSLQRREPR